ncbi:NXPE family member 3-like isoform X1 [Branchiostoma floridae]|uniref:NXPE family member 3-like isoform X1 n=2 Tax=Branchiostoma floridae TaxID=7739 RepID=A0A9J7LDJ7_BRAFL|nr:NXPE family member 3-like isoform X1 [Branchiostoma floridae]
MVLFDFVLDRSTDGDCHGNSPRCLMASYRRRAAAFVLVAVFLTTFEFLFVTLDNVEIPKLLLKPRLFRRVETRKYNTDKPPQLKQVSPPNDMTTTTPHEYQEFVPLTNITTTKPHQLKHTKPLNSSTNSPPQLKQVSQSNNTKPCELKHVTCPPKTKTVVLNGDRLYHKGDDLTVRVVARDEGGRPKTYGGDFFRARLVSTDRLPLASSAGHVTDHSNGTYTMQFPLYWTGNISIKIQLVHPSEAVAVLQRVRETPNKRVFNCSFVDLTTNATQTRQCYSSIDASMTPRQLCDLSKRDVNVTWICEKPDKLPCSTISMCHYASTTSRVKTLGLLSQRELFQEPYIEEELKVETKEPIRVLETELAIPQHLPACTWDKSAAQGYWSGKVWQSSVCDVRVFSKNDIRQCLANKTVYMYGDSTIRQWYLRLKKVLPLFNDNRTMDSTVLLGGDNSQWNISVRYRFHHFPIQTRGWVDFRQLRYIADELDAIHGGPNTVIFLGLWAHFTADPLEMIQSRLYAIRGAVHRLKQRSPGTRVFVRTGTTREHSGVRLEYYLLGSDCLAYQITEVIREMFRADPDVVVLDTWDMSVCQPGKDSVHPDQTMVDNQLNILFSHICPNKTAS